jgi:uncharacterized protein
MDAIHIPQLLKDRDHTRTVEIEDFLPDLPTLTPVKGKVIVKHQENYLELVARADTIVTLTCDRCLQNYNYRLRTNASEFIWLKDLTEMTEPDSAQEEIAYEDLVETLPIQGYFHPDVWLYEQLCLQLPLQKLCATDCPGIQVEQPEHHATDEKPIDRRWASLEALRDRLPK